MKELQFCQSDRSKFLKCSTKGTFLKSNDNFLNSDWSKLLLYMGVLGYPLQSLKNFYDFYRKC